MTNDKKKVETGETMTEVAQRAKENAAGLEAVGKSLSELLKNVTMIQNSAASTHALAEKNLKSIQENSEDIKSIKEKTSLLQERQDHQGRGLDECLARMEKTTPNPKPTLKRSRESPGLAGNAAKLPGSFKCKDCDKVFRSKVGLSEHHKEKHVNELDQAGEDVTNVEEDSDNEDILRASYHWENKFWDLAIHTSDICHA